VMAAPLPSQVVSRPRNEDDADKEDDRALHVGGP